MKVFTASWKVKQYSKGKRVENVMDKHLQLSPDDNKSYSTLLQSGTKAWAENNAVMGFHGNMLLLPHPTCGSEHYDY